MSLSTMRLSPPVGTAPVLFSSFPGLPDRDAELHAPAILHQYEHSDELLAAVQQYAEASGFAVVKRRSTKHRKTNEVIEYDIECTCGRNHTSKSTYRASGTSKTGCKWKGQARLSGITQYWSFKVIKPYYNHSPSTLPGNIAANRRRNQVQIEARIHALAGNLTLSHSDIAATVQEELDIVVKPRDVSNLLQKKRLAEYEGRTPTQQFLYILENDPGVIVKKRINPQTGRIDTIFWTYEHLLALWQRNPCVLSMDNTYKVNRFNMPLFEVTGTTCIHSTFNIAFCLVSDERELSYAFIAKELATLCQSRNIDLPNVIITDFDKALKNALAEAFPGVQQQLCTWHIMKNVIHNIKKKWVGGSLDGQAIMGNAADPAPDLPVQTASHTNTVATEPIPQVPGIEATPDAVDAADAVINTWYDSDEQDGRDATRLLKPEDRHTHTGTESSINEPADQVPPRRPDNRTYTGDADGMLLAWKSVVYASTEDLFNRNWVLLAKEFPKQQGMAFPSKFGYF
jgi:hypothetical protein